MKRYTWIWVSLMLILPACGGDQKSSDERAQEAQRAIQEGMAKERKMYEGMTKGAEDLQKKAEEKTK